jgi:hypothetical protein
MLAKIEQTYAFTGVFPIAGYNMVALDPSWLNQ